MSTGRSFHVRIPILGLVVGASFSHQAEEFLLWRRWRTRLRTAGGSGSGSGIWQAACDCACCDGSANYSITGLWTAAQHNVPCTFVIVRNGVYEALKDYGAFLGTTELPGMNLPGIDFVSLAAGYGLRGRRVSNAIEMADALKGRDRRREAFIA